MATPTLVTNTGGKCGATLIATKLSGGICCTSTTRDISLHWAHSRKVYVGTERQASEWATVQHCENQNNRQSNIIKDAVAEPALEYNFGQHCAPQGRAGKWRPHWSIVARRPTHTPKRVFPNAPSCIIFVASEHHSVGGQLQCSNLREFA